MEKLGRIGSDEDLQRVECLRDNLRHLRERWDNRLVLEDSSLWEVYSDGRAEIILYGDWGVGSDDANWAVRIPAHRAVFESIGANPGVDIIDVYDGDRRQEIIVMIEVAEASGGPKIEVRVPARFYVFEDKFCGIGEGLLYRDIVGGNFKVFPFFRKRKMEFLGGPNDAGGGIHPVVEGFSKIVDCIAHDRAKMLCDWLFGPVGEAKTIRFSQDCYRAFRPVSDFIQVLGQGGRIADNLFNQAIGPFNL